VSTFSRRLVAYLKKVASVADSPNDACLFQFPCSIWGMVISSLRAKVSSRYRHCLIQHVPDKSLKVASVHW
jgi:hypothetical protein